MKKVKRILISLAAFWLVCYAVLFLFIGPVFNTTLADGSELPNQPIARSLDSPTVLAASANPTGQIPLTGQSDLLDLITLPILPASMVTVFGSFSVLCGSLLVRLGCRGSAPLLK